MKLIAHLTRDGSIRKEGTLKEHCIKTADYAVQSIGYNQYSQNIQQELSDDAALFQKKGINFCYIIDTA